MTNVTSYAFSAGYRNEEHVLIVTTGDDGRVTDWKIAAVGGEVTEATESDDSWGDDDSGVLSAGEIAEVFENGDLEKRYPDVFEFYDFSRYGHSDTASGIIYKETKQFLGIFGYYDSWNGTDWNREHSVSNVKTEEIWVFTT